MLRTWLQPVPGTESSTLLILLAGLAAVWSPRGGGWSEGGESRLCLGTWTPPAVCSAWRPFWRSYWPRHPETNGFLIQEPMAAVEHWADADRWRWRPTSVGGWRSPAVMRAPAAPGRSCSGWSNRPQERGPCAPSCGAAVPAEPASSSRPGTGNLRSRVHGFRRWCLRGWDPSLVVFSQDGANGSSGALEAARGKAF